MATKLALTAALLVAMVAFATATTYTTTVTTTTLDDDEANPGRQQQCERQIQGRQFRSCQRYLGERRRGPPSDEVIEMSIENPGQQQQQQLKDCCQQLRSVNEQCRCEAIRHAVRQQQREQGGGSWQGEQMQQVYQKAQNLPRDCNFRQPRECRIQAIFI